jgi:hypothetical protein
MTFTTNEAVAALLKLMKSTTSGLGVAVQSLRATYGKDGPQPVAALHFTHAPAEFQELAGTTKYPAVQIYCEKVESRPSERLRPFSGRMTVVVEVRVSQDRLEGIMEQLLLYMDSVRSVVEASAGCIATGLYLSNEYEARIEPVKKGGLNYLQCAKICCTVIVNRG